MYTVGLDVDNFVSTIMVTLLIIIGLFAEKIYYSFGPLSLELFGKIQTLLKEHIFKKQLEDLEKEESAGNFESLEELSGLISRDLHISDHLSKHKRPETDEEFGYYLAGLIEGDGYFGDHRFEIAFHEDDSFLAYYIKKRIGYGSVLKLKGKRSVRYVLRHSDGIRKILNLVNGKFRAIYKINQLLKHGYDTKFGLTILPPAKFDLNSNHWLTGFAEADGSFVISISKSPTHKIGYNIRLEFKIKQKNEDLLEDIKEYLGGNIYYLKNDQIFYYNSTSFKFAKNVADYFDRYQLNSSKLVRYLKWRKAYRRIQRKEHLTQEGLNKIRKLQRNLKD
jgi:hypothetical protein